MKSGLVQFANLSCTILGKISAIFIVLASISYQITCSPSIDSDQPTHSRSLVRVSAQSGQSCTILGKISAIFIVLASISYQITCSPSIDSDQPTHSRSLVRVSAQSGQSLCCLHESDFQSSISLSICPFEDSLLRF